MPEISKRDMVFSGAAFCCALGLFLEYLLRAGFSASLCGTQACDVAGSYLKLWFLGEGALILLGGVFFLVLAGLAWSPKRIRGAGWFVIWILLLGALSFDGALMGYQASIPGPPCLLCVGVAVGLGLVLMAAAWRTGLRVAFVYGLVIWLCAFSGNFILDHSSSVFSNDTPSLQEAAISQQESGDGSENTRYSLFFSLDCPHCSEVLFNLAQAQPRGIWSLASIDRDPDDLEKLARAVSCQKIEGNLFDRILQAKWGDFGHKGHTPAEIKKATENALAYFEAMDLPGVPTLVVERPNGIRMSIPGTRNIDSFLRKEGMLDYWQSL